MISTVSTVSRRTFSSQTARVFQKFISPNELIAKTAQQQVEDEAFRNQLLHETTKPYEPRTFSSHETYSENNKRPVPLNVELLKYKPLRHAKTHGDEVCTLTLRGYNEPDLERMGEFALRCGYYLGIPMSHLMRVKTENRLYTVIKSPFAQAKTKQNFHRTTYNKKLIAYDATAEVVDLWLSYLNKYKFDDVEMKATVSVYESLDYNQSLQSQELELPAAYNGISDPVALKVKELLGSEEFRKHL
ncbi:mitochondrial 37S ribosomal protein uS10m [Lodderomyces beijingensis]|uniref:Small ribosomal subunit protein uS10 domain-containing protein n=1 Tax=Lodderomyces beijingensis TaxID=1775926 RepID=A0ABP0ZNX5_9ASCO